MAQNDYRLFKYRRCNEFLDKSITTSTFYGARPDELNDPFDCQIDIEKALDRAIRQTAGERQRALTEFMQRHGEEIRVWSQKAQGVGVCAYSMLGPEQQASALLWSHYADHHRGVCLLYEFKQDYLNSVDNGFLGTDVMQYGQDAFTEWLINSKLDPQDPHFTIEMLKLFLMVKGEPWRYENEGRILRMKHGEFEIPKEALIQVCFGLRTPEAEIERISNLIRKHTNCKSLHRMVHADSDFGITAAEI